VTSSGEASLLIHPFDGDLRLNSAIIPDSEFNKLSFSDKHFRLYKGALTSADKGTDILREAISERLLSIILSKIVILIFDKCVLF
jgi:hypothetical protein